MIHVNRLAFVRYDKVYLHVSLSNSMISGTVPPPPKNKMIRQNATGTKGRNVALISNSFEINFKKPSLKIYQFDLSIVNPSKRNDDNANSVPSKGVCDEVYRQLNLGAKWAYDGKKNLYSPSGEGVNISRYVQYIQVCSVLVILFYFVFTGSSILR